MIRALFNGTSGMAASQQGLTTISNNIANSQTTGFKGQRTEFGEVFYQQMKSPSAPGAKYAGTNPIDIGNGVMVASISNNFSQGNVTYTGNKTDLAIQGEGFFITGDYTGRERLYTRAGNFDISKDNQLINKSGKYVLGWNMDPLTGDINTGATLEPIELPLGKVSQPNESTKMTMKGNLDISLEQGEMFGFQVPSWDRLGVRHDIDVNFIKTGGNEFKYIATPVDQFKPSAGITNAVLRPSEGIAGAIMKGDYKLDVSAPVAGNVDITVTAPDGSNVLTQTVSDVNQTITLSDGTDSWFTIDYMAGQGATSSSFTVGEAGDIEFNSIGQIQTITGSSITGKPQITYTPEETGQPVTIDMNLDTLTGLSADSTVKMIDTDGIPASTLTNYTITDGGKIDGYYSDGSIRPIGQIATATFSNPSGLTRVGGGNWLPTPNSGIADVGLPDTSSRGQMKAQALETSNVDMAEEFVKMLSTQKFFQANTKVIRAAEDIMNNVINLIR